MYCGAVYTVCVAFRYIFGGKINNLQFPFLACLTYSTLAYSCCCPMHTVLLSSPCQKSATGHSHFHSCITSRVSPHTTYPQCVTWDSTSQNGVGESARSAHTVGGRPPPFMTNTVLGSQGRVRRSRFGRVGGADGGAVSRAPSRGRRGMKPLQGDPRGLPDGHLMCAR